MPWRLPEKLPPLADLRTGVEALEADLRPVARKHAAQCVAKLLAGFNERKTAAEAELLTEIWLEACGDLPADLWSEGTLELLRSAKWMPKPAELRETVADRLLERQEKLRRANAMLAKAREMPTPSAETFEPEPLEVRLRSMRDSLRRFGHEGRAARAERDLAKLEGREPEDWASEKAKPPIEPPAPAPAIAKRELPADIQAHFLRRQAATFRKQGFEKLAVYHERQADALDPRAPEREFSPLEHDEEFWGGEEPPAAKALQRADFPGEEPPPSDLIPDNLEDMG